MLLKLKSFLKSFCDTWTEAMRLRAEFHRKNNRFMD
jgi:hypothetical protein